MTAKALREESDYCCLSTADYYSDDRNGSRSDTSVTTHTDAPTCAGKKRCNHEALRCWWLTDDVLPDF